jgi:hypothetical protein
MTGGKITAEQPNGSMMKVATEDKAAERKGKLTLSKAFIWIRTHNGSGPRRIRFSHLSSLCQTA